MTPIKQGMKQKAAGNFNKWGIFQDTLKAELQKNTGFFWPFAFWWLHSEKYGL